MNCEYCNTPIPFNATQCPGCGAPAPQQLQQSSTPQYQPRPPVQPVIQPVVQSSPAPVNSKNRVVYIVLGLLLGCFGIHNFYAERIGRGIAQLLITVLLGWVGIGWVITGIWALIDVISVTTDGKGNSFC